MGNCCIKLVEELEKEIKYHDKQGNVIPKAEWEKIWSKTSQEILGKPLLPIKNNVNHPEYYISNGMEVIDVIEAFNLNFHLGNAVKYILRAGKKSLETKTDIQKAIWYLNHFIK